MAVRERTWETRKGEVKSKWICQWVANGSDHIKTFKTQKEARDYEATVRLDQKAGIHIPDSEIGDVGARRGGLDQGGEDRAR